LKKCPKISSNSIILHKAFNMAAQTTGVTVTGTTVSVALVYNSLILSLAMNG